MGQSRALRIRDYRAIVQLAHECRDLGDDHASWRLHLFASLARLTGSALAAGGDCLDFLGRWPPPVVNTTSWGWENGLNKQAWLDGVAAFQSDPNFSVSVRAYRERSNEDPGVALTRTDLVPDRVWEATPEYWAANRPMGTNHTLGCFRALPGPGGVYTGVGLWRAIGDPDYHPRDRALLREAMAAVIPLVGGPLAGGSEPAPSGLPPRARQVLRCLLEGDGDKQVALRLGLSKHTVNDHTKVIFAHFGVSSRPELLARWVRRGWGRKSGWVDGGNGQG